MRAGRVQQLETMEALADRQDELQQRLQGLMTAAGKVRSVPAAVPSATAQASTPTAASALLAGPCARIRMHGLNGPASSTPVRLPVDRAQLDTIHAVFAV